MEVSYHDPNIYDYTTTKRLILTKARGELSTKTIKSWRTKLKGLLIDSGSFSEEQFTLEGGFLNKRYWQANLFYGSGKTMDDNFSPALAFIRLKYSQLYTCNVAKAVLKEKDREE